MYGGWARACASLVRRVVDGGVAVQATERGPVAFRLDDVPLVLGRDVLENQVVEAGGVGYSADHDKSLKSFNKVLLLQSLNILTYCSKCRFKSPNRPLPAVAQDAKNAMTTQRKRTSLTV